MTFFSLSKPRDIVAGTFSGLKNIGRGIGYGLIAIVGGPIIG